MRTQLIAILVLSLAMMVSATPASSATVPLRLVFTSDWSGGQQLYAADPSGSALTRQLISPCADGFYLSCGGRWAFSPDGRRLLTVRAFSGKLARVFVADADGSHARAVARIPEAVPVPPALSWSSDARGFGWTDALGFHFVDARGRELSVVLPGGARFFGWSPSGLSYAYVTWRNDLVVGSAASRHVVAKSVGRYLWAPSGRWLVVEQQGEWRVVHPDGSGARDVMQAAPYEEAPAWSADGRWLALTPISGPVMVYDTRSGSLYTIAQQVGVGGIAWSPVHDRLAIVGGGSLRIADLDRGVVTTIGSAAGGARWAPDGSRLAFLKRSGDLDVAELDGTVHTVVHADGPFGGRITDFGWAQLPPRTKLTVARRSLGTTTSTTVQALWDIGRLTVDGGKVAFEACGHVFVWTPAAQSIEQADPAASLAPRCPGPGGTVIEYLYDLALADDGVLYAWHFNSTSTYWTVTRKTLGAPGGVRVIDGSAGLFGSPSNLGMGQLAGGGPLLVYSRWQRSQQQLPGSYEYPIISTTLERIEPDGTTTPLHVDPGPLITADVDNSRIAVYGTQALLLLDRDGHQLLSLPVAALGARLNGNDLVVLTQGRLHEYDAITGAELRSWPLPDVVTGKAPGGPDFSLSPPALDLDDLAHGLALYHIHGQIHLLRLSDGQDATVASGTLARFSNTGLVYANGNTLTLVPFADLPLH